MLPEPEDDENDMLDMAFGLSDTYVLRQDKAIGFANHILFTVIRSRLGCQVKLTKELDGMVATLPAATRNFFVDGKKFDSIS